MEGCFMFQWGGEVVFQMGELHFKVGGGISFGVGGGGGLKKIIRCGAPLPCPFHYGKSCFDASKDFTKSIQ